MSPVTQTRKQLLRGLSFWLVGCMWMAIGPGVAAATVVQLPLSHLGEVDRAEIDAQGAAHPQGWRGLHFDYKMGIAAEVDPPGPFEEFTVFPYIESLVWHEARVVQYLEMEDDGFAEEYSRNAALYPEALLFQVVIAGAHELLYEQDLKFVYEDSTGSSAYATIHAHELLEPTFFQRHPSAIVWVSAELPNDVEAIQWFSLHGLSRLGPGRAQAKWVLQPGE